MNNEEDGEENKEEDGEANNEEDGEENKEEEGEEDDYGEEEEEDNSFIEIYFQPKFQFPRKNSFKVRCMLEVLYVFMDEKMFDDLRTK